MKIFTGFPLDGEVFDFYFDFHGRRFKPWTSIVPKFEYDPSQSMNDLFVPTADTVKYCSMLKIFSCNRSNALLIGDLGVGKSNVIK